MGTVAVGKNQAVIAAYLTMPVDLGSSALQRTSLAGHA